MQKKKKKSGSIPLEWMNMTLQELSDWYFTYYAANIYTEVLDRTKAEAAREVAATLDLLE